jgi:hypothetical protein
MNSETLGIGMSRSDKRNPAYENKYGEDIFGGEKFNGSGNIPNLPLLKRLKRKITTWYSYGSTAYFNRINSIARLLQFKYYLNDYVLKKEYKVIDYRQEFQQELTFALPFAYWHYKNGTLSKTVSCKFTKELYFFSKNHEEKYDTRLVLLPKETYEIPNKYHCATLDSSKWLQVPLKEYYKNELFIYDKPLLIIANKYNTEWIHGPINFFGIPMLDKILSRLRHKYQIVYNRPGADRIVTDNSEILELEESDFIRKNYPDVLIADDLYIKHQDQLNNYNHFQLMLYANCNRFLSVHGGTAALASYFGGKNIILSKCGHEHRLNEFNTVFPALSGTTIYHARKDMEVFDFLDKHF